MTGTSKTIWRLSAITITVLFSKWFVSVNYEPLVENRNRKPLKQITSLGNQVWELRLGNIRVFYQVLRQEVLILAIGEKEHNILRIDGKEFEL